MMTRAAVFTGVVLMGLVCAPLVLHADSGRVRNFPAAGGDVERVGQVMLNLPTIPWARDLCIQVREVPSTPTQYTNVIIDVFSYPTGVFMSEGIYYCTPETGCNNPHVLLSKSIASGPITIIVRGVAGSGEQTGIPLAVAVKPEGWGCFEPSATWVSLGHFTIAAGPRLPVPTGMLSQTHVTTVQEQQGTNDTLLMVLNNEEAFALDDNGGLAQMSFLCTPQACPAGQCAILPARRTNVLPGTPPADDPTRFHAPVAGPVTVVWDEGTHRNVPWFVPRADADLDGLGDDLEVFLGTCDPNSPNADRNGDGTPDCQDTDVDGDGIPDSYEVLGMVDEPGKENSTSIHNITRFPYYGADPLRQDLFVEVNWTRGRILPDERQWDAAQAEEYANRFAPEIAVHMDIGPLRANVHENETRGNWGGARREADDFDDGDSCVLDCNVKWCGRFNDEGSRRLGLFHHLVVSEKRLATMGLCPRVDHRGTGGAHETGHWLGLAHSGHQSCAWYSDLFPNCEGADGEINCKPHYISIMNYAYQDSAHLGQGQPHPGFSHGRFLAAGTGHDDVVLNATSMDEHAGLWPLGNYVEANDGPVVDLIRDAFGRQVDRTSGSIDWDLDRNILPPGATTRAFLNRANSTADCDPAPPSRNIQAVSSTIPFASQHSNVYSAITNTETGFALYAAMNCSAVGCHPEIYKAVVECNSGGDNPCRSAQPWTKVSALTSNALHITAAGDIVVYVDSDTNQLRYLGISGQGAKLGGPMGGPAVAGPPTAVLDPTGGGPGGNMHVYAAVTEGTGGGATTTLRVWRYDATSDTWPVAGEVQRWSTGDAIEMLPGTAIGTAYGYRSDVTNPSGEPGNELLAAIPAVNSATGTAELHLAMLVADPLVVELCIGTGFFHACIPLLSTLVERWEALPADIWAGTGGRPEANIGRVGLAFRPEDPGVSPNPRPGRFYVTWQFKGSGGRSEAFMSLTRGNELPLSATPPLNTARGLVFLPRSYVWKLEADWPVGMSSIYAGGHVRGVGNINTFMSGYFPNVDGIFDREQRDHDDMTHIRKRLGCALRQCGSRNDD